MATSKCQADARRLQQKCAGIMPTTRLTRARLVEATNPPFAPFGPMIRLRWSSRIKLLDFSITRSLFGRGYVRYLLVNRQHNAVIADDHWAEVSLALARMFCSLHSHSRREPVKH